MQHFGGVSKKTFKLGGQVLEINFTPTWAHVFQIAWYGLTQGAATIVLKNPTVTLSDIDKE